jgi:hypothetical protein
MEPIVNFIKDNWLAIIAVYLLLAKFMTGLRDVLDKTPKTDDNIFERICSIMSRLADYLLKFKRPV